MTVEARFSIRRGDFALDVRFSVPARGVTAVFGPSGCGKTTLLRAMAGLECTPGGYVRVGDDIWQDDTRFVAPHRRALGYVFQESSLFAHLSVRGNLEYGMRRVPQESRRIDFDSVVRMFDLSPLLTRHVDGLSGGERQRVAIARALLTSPRMLLMDEPLASLDATRKREILPFLERLHEEFDMPVLYVSHDPDEVARLADHMVLLEAGRVRASGPLAELMTRLDLQLAHDDDAGAVIEATVVNYDKLYHVTLLEFSGGQFTLAREIAPIGRTVRLRVLARDVSLTLERQTGTSILNIFPCFIESVTDENPAQVMLRLNANGVSLLARITSKSAAALGLSPGRKVFAQVKSVALL